MDKYNLEITKLTHAKKQLLNMYLLKEISQDIYQEKSSNLDLEINTVLLKRKDLLDTVPLLDKTEEVNFAVKQYCNKLKMKFEQLSDFDTKRQFILDHISKVVFYIEKIEIHGIITIQSGEMQIKIPFCIYDKIPRADRVCRFGERTKNKIIRLFEFNEILEKQSQ